MKQTKFFKSIIGLTAIVTLLVSLFSISASAAISPSEAKNGVVVVMREDANAYGSGFAIGKKGKPVEYIVTNYHVVNNVDTGEEFSTATVWFSLASDSKMIASVVYSDESKDLVVLRLPEATTQRQALTLCPMEYVNPDDTFVALGYPGNQVTAWPRYNTDDITVTRGGIKKADRIMDTNVYMLDLSITNGNSGGPLINSSGEVVGINTFSVSGENYAIVIDELLDGIDTRKIPVSLHFAFPLIPVIIGGSVLLVIIALVIILLMRRKRTDIPSIQSNVISSNTNVTNTGTVQKPPVVPAQPRAGARLIAVGGTLNAKKYSISGTVKMGRDASKCAVSFPVNTQGVSGVHCEISYDGTVCYLKDLNSSYGTFTMNGQRLTPDMPYMLHSGDKFYLAGPENTFEVRF